ncbi:MAG: hypothetical protein ACUVTX_03795 [Bacteroidales bacterium]
MRIKGFLRKYRLAGTFLLLITFSVLSLSSDKPEEQVSQGNTIINSNLTRGIPSDTRFIISGGKWNRGWEVTGDLDRLMIDVGYIITDGYFEVVVTRKGDLVFTERKRNWMGLFLCPDGNKCPGGYARAGAEAYGFSKAEIFSASQTSCGGDQQPVTGFRYATVGGILTEKNGWHHGSLVGLKVLKVKIVDYK